MRKITLLFVVLVAILTTNTAFVAVPASITTEAPAATSNIVVAKKASKGKLFMKILKSKFEKIAQKGKKAGDKSKIVAALLAFFLGNLGIHDFYLGNKRNGIIKIGLTLLGMGLYIAGIVSLATTEAATLPVLALIGAVILFGVSIWALIDFIRILTGSYEPVDGSYTD